MCIAFIYGAGYNYDRILRQGGNVMKRKLTSRKLWLSVANFVSMLLVFFNYSESEASQVAALIMAGGGVIGYVIGEGLADGGNKKIED